MTQKKVTAVFIAVCARTGTKAYATWLVNTKTSPYLSRLLSWQPDWEPCTAGRSTSLPSFRPERFLPESTDGSDPKRSLESPAFWPDDGSVLLIPDRRRPGPAKRSPLLEMSKPVSSSLARDCSGSWKVVARSRFPPTAVGGVEDGLSITSLLKRTCFDSTPGAEAGRELRLSCAGRALTESETCRRDLRPCCDDPPPDGW